VEFIGEIDDSHKADFLGNALALLFPIDWPEPFGLVMIEAMSTGTPVIAWPNGSVPEVLEDGLTAVLVDTLDAAVRAVETARRMDRPAIRQRFETRFTARGMVTRYIHAYERVLHQAQSIAPGPISSHARRPVQPRQDKTSGRETHSV
jgi:glycosyltransferase involved in cell wall biosynthesis